jgi:hypothetical protein
MLRAGRRARTVAALVQPPLVPLTLPHAGRPAAVDLSTRAALSFRLRMLYISTGWVDGGREGGRAVIMPALALLFGRGSLWTAAHASAEWQHRGSWSWEEASASASKASGENSPGLDPGLVVRLRDRGLPARGQ